MKGATNMEVRVTNKANDCENLTKERAEINFTAEEIREILGRPEYATVPPTDRTKLTPEQSRNVGRYENINSFGAEVADLFEDLCEELHRIPTQKEFCDRGLELTEKWWITETLKKNPMIRGLQFDATIQQAVRDRQGRSYLSIVNEVYTAALLKEMYPEARVITNDILDLVLGVDIVMEYKGKRLYFHVYKNSYWGRKAFIDKENRGGMRNSTGAFVKYHRDFSGDISLVYDTTETGTTEIINGIPLFTKDYIDWQVSLALKNGAVGETLGSNNNKLEKVNNWLYKHFDTFVDFYK